MTLFKLLALTVSLLILQACSNTKPLNEEMKLYVFDCGTITVKDISLFSPNVDVGKSKKLANSCYLIKHPQGNFLWDTGLNDELATMEHGLTVGEGMFTLAVKNPLVAQLKAIGLTPTDIDYVALSHFHFDHTGNMNLFSNADVLLQNDELRAAFSDKAEEMHFDPTTYSGLDKSKFLGLTGRYDVFNDGKVILIPASGHTPGHQSLLVNLKETGAIMLSGDLYHFSKNREHRRVPALNYDKEMTLKTMDNIEKMLKDTNATLWIQHDLESFTRLKQSPSFYQ